MCTHPLMAYKRLQPNENGKRPIVFGAPLKGEEQVPIPCGQCMECRLAKARNWKIRMMMEQELHTHSCFITLTYDKYNLYKCKKGLNKREMELFLKRLRKAVQSEQKKSKAEKTIIGKTVRYYQCGEYGDKYGRPHHHAILFGLDFNDKERVGGSDIFTSGTLADIWGNGIVSIDRATPKAIGYVADYVTKKLTGPKAKSAYKNHTPEFATMSLRPAIGRRWCEKFGSDIRKGDSITLAGGREVIPPRYFDKVMSETDEREVQSRKDKRIEKMVEIGLDFVNRRNREIAIKNRFKHFKKRKYENG